MGFWVLVLCCTSKFSPIHKHFLGFLYVALAGLFNFFQFKVKNGFLPNCYQFTTELGNLYFWSPLDFILYLSDYEDSLRHRIFVKVLGILFPSLNEINNSKTLLGWHQPLDPRMYLEQTILVCLHLALLRLFPICNNIFIP